MRKMELPRIQCMIGGVNLVNDSDVALKTLNKSQLIFFLCQCNLVTPGACSTHRHCSDDAPSRLIEATFLGDVGY